jgi:hypothetical protein
MWGWKELLGPCVQDGEDADGSADEAGIAGDVDNGVGCGLHQQGIAVALVGTQNGAQFLGHGDGDMEIMAGQHLGFAPRQPMVGIVGVAFGTGAAVAGMIGEDLVAAMIAMPEASAEGFGATVQNVGDGATMRRRHRRAIGREVAVRKTVEDIGDFDHGRFRWIRDRSSACRGWF